MMNARDSSLVLDVPRLQHAVMMQVCEVAFGPDVYTSPQIVTALEQAIPMFVSMLHSMPAEKRHMKYALEIARQLGVDVRRMERSDERRMCFEAALILVLSYFPEGFAVKYANVNELVTHYPEFSEVEAPELLKLLNFRNMLSVALLLLPANHNRSHLLDLVTRLTEGRNVKYVTGSGAAIGTRRRVLLYQREGNVTPLARPPRRENPEKNGDRPAKKRVRNNSLVVARTSSSSASASTTTSSSSPSTLAAPHLHLHDAAPFFVPNSLMNRPNFYMTSIASTVPQTFSGFVNPMFPHPAHSMSYMMPNYNAMPTVMTPHYQQFGSLPVSIPTAPTYPSLPSFFHTYASDSSYPNHNRDTSQVTFEQWLREIWENGICSDQQGWAATVPAEEKTNIGDTTRTDDTQQSPGNPRTRDTYVKALELFLQLFLYVEQHGVNNYDGQEHDHQHDNGDELPTCTLSVMELLDLFHAGALRDENPLRAEHLRSLGLLFCIKRCSANGLIDYYGNISGTSAGGENITAEYVYAIQNYFLMQTKGGEQQQMPWQTFSCLQTAYARVMELYFRIIAAVKMGLIKFRGSSWTHMRDMLFSDYQVMMKQRAPSDVANGIHALIASAESLDCGLPVLNDQTKVAPRIVYSNFSASDKVSHQPEKSGSIAKDDTTQPTK